MKKIKLTKLFPGCEERKGQRSSLPSWASIAVSGEATYFVHGAPRVGFVARIEIMLVLSRPVMEIRRTRAGRNYAK